jgi:hypothetical protein
LIAETTYKTPEKARELIEYELRKWKLWRIDNDKRSNKNKKDRKKSIR